MSLLTLRIWLSPIIKIFLPFIKVPAYVLFPGTTFDFCNLSLIVSFCCVNIWSSPSYIIQVCVSFLWEYYWAIFLDCNCWGRSWTCVVANTSFGVLEQCFVYYSNLCRSCWSVLLFSHSGQEGFPCWWLSFDFLKSHVSQLFFPRISIIETGTNFSHIVYFWQLVYACMSLLVSWPLTNISQF